MEIAAQGQSSSTPLPVEWVDRLFSRMAACYGARFVDQWRDFDQATLKAAWAEELAGYTGTEIKRGLDGMKGRPWPPTLPEFMLLCRPLADARAEWAEAREQMALRLRGAGGDRWSRPEVYWAAVAVGNYDLQLHGWETIRSRWENALATAKSEPVPPWTNPPAALPKPGEQCVTREVARERAAVLARQVAARVALEPGNAWAVRLLRREAAGEAVELVAEGAWRAVLGFGLEVAAADALRTIEARATA